MSESAMIEKTIRVLAKELQIPYANMMAAYTIEQFLKNLSGSAYASRLWLAESNRYRLEAYRRKIDLALRFYDTGKETSTDEETQNMLQSICGQAGDTGQADHSGIYWEITKKENWMVTAVIGSRHIPLSIQLFPLQKDDRVPVQTTVHLCSKNNEGIFFYQYPAEDSLVENLTEIMEHLELIRDMQVYEDVWQILTSESVDGRKIEQQLLQQLTEKGIHPDQKRMDLFCSYRDYRYMKKKWNSYLKRQNQKEPVWEDVMEKILAFLQPVWEMMQQDMIFIGDWMPELGRYL